MKIALIGSGNAFFRDEGAGLYAAKYLKENYTFDPSVDIVDGGTLGFKLMPLLQEYDAVIIANTSSEKSLKPGTVTVKTTEEFLDGDVIKKTANEVEIAEMLQICSLSEQMAEVRVVSIVPEDIVSVSVSLTASLCNAWGHYIETILKQLEDFGIKYEEQEEVLHIDKICEIFASPSLSENRTF